MPTLFWKGQLPLPLKLMLNMGFVFAWLTGNARNTAAMKEKMKDGYDGKYSDYIHKYDELASFHYEKISDELLNKIDVLGKAVADIGCGTGILSVKAMGIGVKKISCVDMSNLMLEKCKKKIAALGYNDDQIILPRVRC